MIQRYQILLNIIPQERPNVDRYRINVNVEPAGIGIQTLALEYPFNIIINPIRVNLSDPIKNSAYQFLNQILSTYVDEDRELKTLVNYGDDRQTVALAYRSGTIDSNGNDTIQFKLLRPLPDDVGINTPVFISREVANTIIDKVRVRFTPPLDETPYLRPKNTYVKVEDNLGNRLKNVTLELLALTSGSIGSEDESKNISFEDSIFRKWYSYDFNSAELNLDFTDYNNFVFYGSAQMRLDAFKQKLLTIEKLEQQALQFTGSFFTGSVEYAGANYISDTSAKNSLEKENVIRSFDRYEQYLYFTPSGSNSPYTASAWYADYGYEYNPIAYWPKTSNGELYSVNSTEAIDWFETQSLIAQRFDEFNENNLINTVPTHIREDSDNGAYFTFVVMIGHFFDTIKPYVDQFPNIYSRYINPNEELSKDLVSQIAESVGFQLPSINSIYSLSETILGTDSIGPRRDFTIESHKRLLHNLPYFMKTKGTRTALMAVLRTLGISQELIDVRESGLATGSSYYVFNEYYNGIDFDTDEVMYIKLPILQSERIPRSIQLNLTLAGSQNSTILTGDDNWSLKVTSHPTIDTLGKFELTSGSSTILSSSYQQIFEDEPINVSIRTYTNTLAASLTVAQTNQEDVIFNTSYSEESGSNVFIDLWDNTDYVYIGGSGSLKTDNLNGTLDEVRLWGINLTDDRTLDAAFDAGSNVGNEYTDASNYLYAQLSFNRIDTGSLPTTVINETPYTNVAVFPSLETFEVSGITTSSFGRYSRSVRQRVAENGSTAFITNKVKVAPPPVFTEDNLTKDGVKTLSRTESIVKLSQKPIQRGKNKVLVSTSPTKIINDNIIRNIGATNISNAFGIPNDTYKSLDKTLQDLQDHYVKYYYVNVDTNQYIRTVASVNSVINQLVDYFIPSKASPLNGVVIEPNVLERNKFTSPWKIKAYGAKTRRTQNAANSLTGSRADYDGTFNLSQEIEVVKVKTTEGDYSSFTTQIADVETAIPSGYMLPLSGVAEVISDETLPVRSEYQTFTSQSKLTTDVSTLYSDVNVYDKQHENWKLFEQISQSLTPPRPARIGDIEILSSNFEVIDLQHLDWKEYRALSRSLNPANDEFITLGGAPLKRVFIDMGTDELYKFSYNDQNAGSINAEPYNKVYTRKLFDYEIELPRIGGITSLVPNALYEIPPSADFRDYGVLNYFSQPNSVYYFTAATQIPKYINPLNQPWNGEEFVGATTWSYGARYSYNDVVYQSEDSVTGITNLDNEEIDWPVAKLGSGKYYAFKTRSSYKDPQTGESFYLNNVPSYLPPSLDKENWARIRFSPRVVPQPKRVVFDTYTVPDPFLNNFKVTILDIDVLVDAPSRYVDVFRVGQVLENGNIQGNITVQNIAALFAIQSNTKNLRIRLYRTQEARDADVNRSVETLPDLGSDILIDTTVNSDANLQLINPIVTVVAGDTPPLGKLYYTIDNLENEAKGNVQLALYYFSINNEPRLPQGYLRKHYRFFRDNTLATRRRNIIGCKNTQDTTIDGLPPVQVFLGEGTQITISPTAEQTDIITGGGGTLDVS